VKRLLAVFLMICLTLCMPWALAEEEPVTIRVMREERSIWYPEGEDMNDNVLIRFAEEKLNVKFETALSADPHNGVYANEVNLLIASNNLPDMFYATSGQMQTLYEYGMIQPVGQFFEEYCSEEALAEIAYNKNAFLIGCTFDGEAYGFPTTQDFMGNMPMLYVRQDWLDNLGLSFDKDNFTMDDLMEMCEAFTHGDPDQNGVDDTYAFAFDGNAVDHPVQINTLAHGLGLQVDMWLEDAEGKLIYTDVDESIKPLLTLLQEMYQKGYISEDYVSMEYFTQVSTDMAAGKFGILPAFFWSGLGAPQMAAKADPNAKFAVFPCPRNPEGEYRLQTDVTNYSYLVVNSSFEHPELAVEYMQLWYDLWRGEYAEWYHGLNGTDYAEAQEDFKYYLPFWWDPALKNLNISNKLVYTLETGDETELKKDAEAYKMLPHIQNYLAGEEDWYGFAQYYNFCHGDPLVEHLYGGTDSSRYITNLVSVVPMDPDMAGVNSLLTDLRKEYFNKIIMGADLDSTYAEYVEQWHAIGGDDLAEYYNEWYAANGANFK
jgi:putative aldouronate transport system substrate-binding protein